MTHRLAGGLLIALGLGYTFLYLPILLLIVFSFNESRLVTVWTGFSTKWYGELLRNERILDAAWLSLIVAACSATLAVAIGTLAGVALARYGRFRLRWLFAGLLAAPLIMPEVITGLSLLLMFVSMDQVVGWPASRGFGTIVVAHATLSTAFVAVIVQARLAGFDRAVEEAAADLGARPATVFWRITPAVDRTGTGGGLAARLYAVAGRRRDRKFRGWPRNDYTAPCNLLERAPGSVPAS